MLTVDKMEQSGRYFVNSMDVTDPAFDPDRRDSESGERVWPTKIWNAIEEGLTMIENSISKGDGFRGGSMYIGLGGVALMYFHMAMQCRKGLKKLPAVSFPFAQTHLLSRALDLCSQAHGYFDVHHRRHRVTFLEGFSGVLALKSVLCHYLGKATESKEALRELEAMNQRVSRLPSGECEVLYGRCGYLSSLLFVRHHIGIEAVEEGIVSALVRQVIDQGKSFASARPETSRFQLMYSWHDSHYLGAAHGLAGILHVLSLCPLEVSESYPGGEGPKLIRNSTTALMECCFPSGNLPSSLHSERDSLVHWCHGGPGFVPLLCHFSQEGADTDENPFLVAAKRCNDDIWRRGLLRKGVGLCHGWAGNAYSFLSLYRATGDTRELARARAFATCLADNWKHLVRVPDNPFSLYEGLAGAVCFWVDVLNPEESRFPGFEL